MQAEELRKVYGDVVAVDGVSFSVGAGETLGLVGESGCGKTTLGRLTLGLVPADGGRVRFDGRDGLAMRRRRRARLMQIVFQDPGGSLDGRMRVGRIVAEPLIVHRLARGPAIKTAVAGLLERVGLEPAVADRHPHELSGGQRQRVAIARALALGPRFLVCDEPTSALDVSIQAQILNLLADLQREHELAYLFISHDIAVVDHVSDRIAVMKDGRIVETGDREQVIHRPGHAYTRRLLAAVPRV